MENLETTFITLLAFFGALAVIAGGVKVIIQMFAPFKELQDKTKKHDELLANDNNRFKSLDKTLERIEEGQKVQGRAMMELLNHVITGNDIDRLKKRNSELVDFFIEK